MLFGCYMAGVTWNCCCLCKFCIDNTTVHLFIVSLLEATNVGGMCLAVTCYLHFWQNVRHLLRATAVTQEWNRNQNKSQHRKLILEKKIFMLLLPGIKAVPFWSWVNRSTTEPSLLLTCGVPQPCLGTSSLHFLSAASQSLGPVISICISNLSVFGTSSLHFVSAACQSLGPVLSILYLYICSLSVFGTSSLHFVSAVCQSVMEWVTTLSFTTCLHMTLILQIWFCYEAFTLSATFLSFLYKNKYIKNHLFLVGNLGMATAAIRAALPIPNTSVCSIF